mmetsp:Transcript_56980/g.146665  ORF Transcript_56980/g.146665 Transcript_56980/m.146665 type:complete len:98 (-) Transcript_56980:304-597(-)
MTMTAGATCVLYAIEISQKSAVASTATRIHLENGLQLKIFVSAHLPWKQTEIKKEKVSETSLDTTKTDNQLTEPSKADKFLSVVAICSPSRTVNATR